MTRNLVTELVIRLLAIWFMVTGIAAILLSSQSAKSDIMTYESVISVIAISILSICFSKNIAKIIWIDRRGTDEIIGNNETHNILVPLISIIGLYFIIDSFAYIIHNLIDIYLLLPGYFGDKTTKLYSISTLLNKFLFLVFGILVFSFPEKVLNIRNFLKEIINRGHGD